MRDEQLVEAGNERLAAGLEVACELRQPQRGADAVLVPHQRADGVAERLLVAHHERDALALGAIAALAIHLKPVSVSR